jgi:hypothetical protein
LTTGADPLIITDGPRPGIPGLGPLLPVGGCTLSVFALGVPGSGPYVTRVTPKSVFIAQTCEHALQHLEVVELEGELALPLAWVVDRDRTAELLG